MDHLTAGERTRWLKAAGLAPEERPREDATRAELRALFAHATAGQRSPGLVVLMATDPATTESELRAWMAETRVPTASQNQAVLEAYLEGQARRLPAIGAVAFAEILVDLARSSPFPGEWSGSFYSKLRDAFERLMRSAAVTHILRDFADAVLARHAALGWGAFGDWAPATGNDYVRITQVQSVWCDASAAVRAAWIRTVPGRMLIEHRGVQSAIELSDVEPGWTRHWQALWAEAVEDPERTVGMLLGMGGKDLPWCHTPEGATRACRALAAFDPKVARPSDRRAEWYLRTVSGVVEPGVWLAAYLRWADPRAPAEQLLLVLEEWWDVSDAARRLAPDGLLPLLMSDRAEVREWAQQRAAQLGPPAAGAVVEAGLTPAGSEPARRPGRRAVRGQP